MLALDVNAWYIPLLWTVPAIAFIALAIVLLVVLTGPEQDS